MLAVEKIDAGAGSGPAVTVGVGDQPGDRVIVGIEGRLVVGVEISKDACAGVEETDAGRSANGKLVTGEFQQAVDIAVRKGIGIGSVHEVNGFRSVEAIETVWGGDPEESIVILDEVGDNVAAESFVDGQLFHKMGDTLCGGGNGKGKKG